MNAAAMVILVLTHGGYFLSATDATISVQWSARVDMPPAVVLWDLKYGPVTAASGRVDLADKDAVATVKLKVPEVRTVTDLRWTYRIVKREGGDELARGESVVHVYPAHLLEDFSKRYSGRSLVLLDNSTPLLDAIGDAGLHPTVMKGASQLPLSRPEVLIIGPDAIGPLPFDSPQVEALATAGTQILIFRQTRCECVGSYALADRPTADAVTWDLNHPLLAGFDRSLLTAWLGSTGSVSRIVRLPPDEAAVDVAGFTPETAAREPSPIDAVIVTRTLGAGRIVYVQLPVGEWKTDPRSLILLNNALNYLLTRPEPTPPPNRRVTTRPAQVVPERRIPIGG